LVSTQLFISITVIKAFIKTCILERFGRIALKKGNHPCGSLSVSCFGTAEYFILIQIPSVQNFVKDKAVTYLQNKIHTKVKIDHISLGFTEANCRRQRLFRRPEEGTP